MAATTPLNHKPNNDPNTDVNKFEIIDLEKIANTNEKRKIIVEKRDADGQNLFLKSSSLDFIKYCIETLKVDINQKDENGRTALSISIFFGRTSITRYLLQCGARTINNYKSGIDKTGTYDGEFLNMLEAAERLWDLCIVPTSPIPPTVDLKTIVAQLLTAGASLNQKNKLGQTPLIAAAHFGLEKIFKEFLENGADPLVKDDNGRTAITRAQRKNHWHILAIYFMHNLKKLLLPILNNKEEIEKNKQNIDDTIKQIFAAAEKTQDPSKQAELYLELGLQFKTLQLIPETIEALKRASEGAIKLIQVHYQTVKRNEELTQENAVLRSEIDALTAVATAAKANGKDEASQETAQHTQPLSTRSNRKRKEPNQDNTGDSQTQSSSAAATPPTATLLTTDLRRTSSLATDIPARATSVAAAMPPASESTASSSSAATAAAKAPNTAPRPATTSALILSAIQDVPAPARASKQQKVSRKT